MMECNLCGEYMPKEFYYHTNARSAAICQSCYEKFISYAREAAILLEERQRDVIRKNLIQEDEKNLKEIKITGLIKGKLIRSIQLSRKKIIMFLEI